jgi:hypothetical protein
MTERRLRALFIAGLAPIGLAGVAHAIAALVRPSLFAPTLDGLPEALAASPLEIDPHTIAWDAYLGFALTTGLGIAAVSALLLVLAIRHFDIVRGSFWVPTFALGFAAMSTTIAIHYWFWLPAAACGASTILLAAAATTWPKPGSSS